MSPACVRRSLTIVAIGLLMPRAAEATYSIVVVDTRTHRMAVGVASCVPLDTVAKVAGLVRGRGAFVTQSYLREAAHLEITRDLTEGQSASATLAAVTALTTDADRDLRQYAVLSLAGEAAAFTGPRALAYANHGTLRVDGLVVSVQGNVLSGSEVLTTMADVFAAKNEDPIDRAMRAFEAPSMRSPPVGDARCLGSSRTARAATFDVMGDDPSEDLHVGVDEERAEPLPAVRTKLDAWRREHPVAMAPARDASAGGEPTSASPSARESTGCGASAAPAEGGALGRGAILGLATIARRRRSRRLA